MESRAGAIRKHAWKTRTPKESTQFSVAIFSHNRVPIRRNTSLPRVVSLPKATTRCTPQASRFVRQSLILSEVFETQGTHPR